MQTFEKNGCCLGEVLNLVYAGEELYYAFFTSEKHMSDQYQLFSKNFGGKHVQVYCNLYLLLQRCLLVFHDGL